MELQPYSTMWIFILSILSVWLFVTVIRKKIGKTTKRKRIPGPDVNLWLTTVIPLMNIIPNKTASLGLLVLQAVCGYAHIYRKEGMLFFRGVHKPVLVLYKAETVEPILSSNDVLLKGFEYDVLKRWLKEGLLTSKENKWRYRRKLLTPAFHFHILDEYIPIFNEQAKIFSEKLLLETSLKNIIDISPLASLCTLDMICETAMGKKINAQGNSSSPYVRALHITCSLLTERLLQPWYWPEFIYFRTKKGKTFLKNLQIMDQFTRQVVRERKQQKILQMENDEQKDGIKNSESNQDFVAGRKHQKRLALLDLLLDVHLQDPNFTLEDIAEEVDNFMFAGHDTTSSGISWALYMLGLHIDIQQKVYEELQYVFGDDMDRPIELNDVKELKYLECVLKETRRLYPPTPFIARDLESDKKIDGYLIPKGTNCGILIYMLHRDPDVFPNPEIFDPERFTPANSVGRHPYAYIPFSAGPRNCIGQRFALIQAVITVATILRRFELKSTLPLDKLFVTDEIVLRSTNGLPMSFTPRKLITNNSKSINE